MKKFMSVVLCLLVAVSLFAFSACGEKEPALSDEQISELNVRVDFSGLTNFKEAVANLPVKTSINNYSAGIGYLDNLLLEGKAMKQMIEKENIKNADGLDEFEAAFDQLAGLWPVAEKAAAEYVKGFYKARGEKEVTAVYCYMIVDAASEKGNSYVFALTYNEGETPVTVYMNATMVNDGTDAAAYEKAAAKYFADECSYSMMNTPVYNNITLNLDAVLAAAK